MQSTALTPRLRKASRAIAHPPRTHLNDGSRPASSGDHSRFQLQGAPGQEPFIRYITGWAQADPAMIAGATIDRYHFHDPLVGTFAGHRLSRYFEFLHARFACDGVPAQPVFYLRGPMDGRVQGEHAFFREAPQLGLTGVAHILIGARGVLAETVAYDLNIATEILRSPRVEPTC